MSKSDVTALPDYGPAMQALANDRQRGFVCALFDAPQKIGRLMWAARTAGYGRESRKGLSVIAARLAGNEKIQAAIAEESRRRLRSLAPAAVVGLDKLINDPSHKDHARALAMILDRADPVETSHNVHVTDDRTPPRALAEVMARIDELTRHLAAPTLPAPKVIEGEAFEVGAQP